MNLNLFLKIVGIVTKELEFGGEQFCVSKYFRSSVFSLLAGGKCVDCFYNIKAFRLSVFSLLTGGKCVDCLYSINAESVPNIGRKQRRMQSGHSGDGCCIDNSNFILRLGAKGNEECRANGIIERLGDDQRAYIC
ncbi:Uncharacterized protein Fot_31706 [Forsythia ovata]|uniref:Uncharacterized protein n=1 Tax=Forsythia ovata TaxID=205694 RepID=A0ABD1T5S6_9LAMI